MADGELAQADVQNAQGSISQIQARLGQEHSKLIAEREILAKELENLLAERQATAGPVAKKMLDQYESLRRQRRGVAVAEVTENACSACGTTLTAALQQNARHAEQLVFCPSCGRILFAG